MSLRVARCVALPVLACSAPLGAQQDIATAQFDQLKRLVGTWRVAGNPGSPLRISFALTAGGTVLVESWQRGDRAHSLTLYHRDAGTIVATHYCPQGNQPRLVATPSADRVVRFAFRDATDLDVARESYLTALSFDLSDPTTLLRRESYRRGDSDDASTLRLVREAAAGRP